MMLYLLDSTVVSASDFSDIISALTAQLSVSTMVSVLSTCITACVGLAFAWWGIRKVVKMIMSAFKKGRVSV